MPSCAQPSGAGMWIREDSAALSQHGAGASKKQGPYYRPQIVTRALIIQTPDTPPEKDPQSMETATKQHFSYDGTAPFQRKQLCC